MNILKKILALFLCTAVTALTFPISVLASGTETKAFSIEGGTLGTQYTYENNILTFTQNGTYTVSMAEGTASTATDRIVVANSVQASITLDGVNIDVSGMSTTSALDMSSAGACTVTLAAGSSNSLKSGHDRPGIYVPKNNELIFNGSGSLHAAGGDYWPGIGRNGGGNIDIQSGTINAVGGEYASGIGGSWGYSGGTITISGGDVTASGGYDGSGIGGGSQGDGGSVTISGGTVSASGGRNGSAIGHGCLSSGGGITITGGSVMTSGGMGSQPTNGSSSVYLTQITLTHITTQTMVTSLITSLDTYTYGSEDVSTDNSGVLYFYLPAGTEITAIRTAAHDYTGSIVTTDTGVAEGHFRFPDLVVTGGTQGVDYTYDGDKLAFIRGGTYTVSMVPQAAQAGIDTIFVKSGVKVNLTLDNVRIDASGKTGRSALDITGTSVNLTLVGDSTLKSGADRAGVDAPDGSSLTITDAGSGTLSSAGGSGGAGIGGGSGESGGSIRINACRITASGGDGGAGIGGGSNSGGGTVTITGGTVKASGAGGGKGIGYGGSGSGGSIVITGGSVNASGGLGSQAANGSKPVYLTTVTMTHISSETDVSSLTTSLGKNVYGIKNMTTDDSGRLYLYLPEQTHTTAAATASNSYTGNVTTDNTGGASGFLRFPDFFVAGGTSGKDYSYDTQMLTLLRSGTYTISMASGITQSSVDSISVAAGVTANITLNGVNINFYGKFDRSPFDIASGAAVNLTLLGDNVLEGGITQAGLRVPEGASLLVTAASTGSLHATGGDEYIKENGNWYKEGGAGIGGSNNQTAGKLTFAGGSICAHGDSGAGIGGGAGGSGGIMTFNGGTIDAESNRGAAIGGGSGGSGGIITFNGGATDAESDNGAGIGGGGNMNGDSCGDGGTIVINGGEIAASSYAGAGIGGGGNDSLVSGGSGGTVTITGGTVTAHGYIGAGIGGSTSAYGGKVPNGGTVTITGGTVSASGSNLSAGIGGGYKGSGGSVYISGGSVYAKADSGAENIGKGNGGSSSGILKNRENGSDVYPTTLQLNKAGTAISASDLGFGGVASYYGRNDFKTDADKTLYLYLPAGAASAVYGGALYTANVVGGSSNSFTLDSSKSAFVIDLSLSNLLSGNSPTMAVGGDSYKGTLKPDKGYLLPKAISVTMGGTALKQGTGYTYNENTGEICIPAVTGNVKVTAAGIYPSYSIAALPASLSFGSVTDNHTGKTAAQTVTVLNTGNQTVNLVQPKSADYTITPLSSAILGPDQAATFSVKPNVSLSVGNHDEQIAIHTEQGTAASVTVHLNVTSGCKTMTLDDPATNITVSGSIQGNAVLTVSKLTMDGSDASNAVKKMKNNSSFTFLLGANIFLSQKYSGLLTITIPVGTRYNGRMTTILHVHGGVLETYHAEVKNGAISLKVTSLSPFAVFLDVGTAGNSSNNAASVTDSTVISNPDTGRKSLSRLFAELTLVGAAALTWLFLRRKFHRNRDSVK